MDSGFFVFCPLETFTAHPSRLSLFLDQKNPFPASERRTQNLACITEQIVRKLVPPLFQKTGPPPFANLTRFHGEFAPRAKLWERVVAHEKVRTSTRPAICRSTRDANEGSILDVLPKRRPKAKKDKRYPLEWASPLTRIFAMDVMTCAQCKGVLFKDKRRVVAKVDNPGAVAAMLRHSGLDQDANADPTTVANECGQKLELAFDLGA